MSKDYLNIDYLKAGNSIQRRAYRVIKDLGIMSTLKCYTPILAGTIPIGIDIEGSDLDIICEVYEFGEFEKLIKSRFSKEEGFSISRIEKNDVSILVVNFIYKEFEFEIYAQNLATKLQNAYRHMLLESRVLNLGGEDFRKKIIALKELGIKTEPAFARVLGLKGDPYLELLKLEDFDDEGIVELLKRSN